MLLQSIDRTRTPPPCDLTREHEPCPERLEEDAPLERHRGGHGKDQFVALGRCREGQADAGIAAGRLDERRNTRLDEATLLGVLDHVATDPILGQGAWERERDACGSELEF